MSVRVNDTVLTSGYVGQLKITSSAGLFVQATDKPTTITGTLSVESVSPKLHLPGSDTTLLPGDSLENYIIGRVDKRATLVAELDALLHKRSALKEGKARYGMSATLLSMLGRLATNVPPTPLGLIGGSLASDKIPGTLSPLEQAQYDQLFGARSAAYTGGDVSGETRLPVLGSIRAVLYPTTRHGRRAIGDNLIVTSDQTTVYVYRAHKGAVTLLDKLHLSAVPVSMTVDLFTGSTPSPGVTDAILTAWLNSGYVAPISAEACDALFIGAVYANGHGEAVVWAPNLYIDQNTASSHYALYYPLEGPMRNVGIRSVVTTPLHTELVVRCDSALKSTHCYIYAGLRAENEEMGTTGYAQVTVTDDFSDSGLADVIVTAYPKGPVHVLSDTLTVQDNGHVVVDSAGLVAYARTSQDWDEREYTSCLTVQSVVNYTHGARVHLDVVMQNDVGVTERRIVQLDAVSPSYVTGAQADPYLGFVAATTYNPFGPVTNITSMTRSGAFTILSGDAWALCVADSDPYVVSLSKDSLVDVLRVVVLQDASVLYQRTSGLWRASDKVGDTGANEGEFHNAVITVVDKGSLFIQPAEVDGVGNEVYSYATPHKLKESVIADGSIFTCNGSSVAVSDLLSQVQQLSVSGAVSQLSSYRSTRDGVMYVALSGRMFGFLYRYNGSEQWEKTKFKSGGLQEQEIHFLTAHGMTLYTRHVPMEEGSMSRQAGYTLGLVSPSGLQVAYHASGADWIDVCFIRTISVGGVEYIVTRNLDRSISIWQVNTAVLAIKPSNAATGPLQGDLVTLVTQITTQLNTVDICAVTDATGTFLIATDGKSSVDVYNLASISNPRRRSYTVPGLRTWLTDGNVVYQTSDGTTSVVDHLLHVKFVLAGTRTEDTSSIAMADGHLLFGTSVGTTHSVSVRVLNTASQSFTYSDGANDSLPVVFKPATLVQLDGFTGSVIATADASPVGMAYTPSDHTTARRLVMNHRFLHKSAKLSDHSYTLTFTPPTERLVRNGLLWLVNLSTKDVTTRTSVASTASTDTEVADYRHGQLTKRGSNDTQGNRIDLLLSKVGVGRYIGIPGRFFGVDYTVFVQNANVPVYVRPSTTGVRAEFGEYNDLPGLYQTPGYTGLATGIWTLQPENVGKWWNTIWRATLGTSHTMADLLDTRRGPVTAPELNDLPRFVNPAYLLLAYITQQNVAFALIDPVSSAGVNRVEGLLSEIPQEAIEYATPLCANWIPLFIGEDWHLTEVKGLPYF